MIPVNITIQVEETAKRRSVHGSIAFAKPATSDDAAEALKRNGFDAGTVADGYKRSLYQLSAHFGSQHFEFFISDELLPVSRGADVSAEVIDAEKRGGVFSGKTVPFEEASE